MSGRRTDPHQIYMDFAPLLLYLVAVILRQANSLFTSEAVEEVNNLLSLQKMKLSDCKLYTPTPSDYKNCSLSTLDCFIKETYVLIQEIKEKSKLMRHLSNIRRGASMKNKSPLCPVCEVYKEENAVTFLKTLSNFFEKINSEHGE